MYQKLHVHHVSQLNCKSSAMDNVYTACPRDNFGMQCPIGRSTAWQQLYISTNHRMPNPHVVEKPLDAIGCTFGPHDLEQLFSGPRHLSGDFGTMQATYGSQTSKNELSQHKRVEASSSARTLRAFTSWKRALANVGLCGSFCATAHIRKRWPNEWGSSDLPTSFLHAVFSSEKFSRRRISGHVPDHV